MSVNPVFIEFQLNPLFTDINTPPPNVPAKRLVPLTNKEMTLVSLNPVFKEMADIIYLAALEIEIAVNNLRNPGANRIKILDACINLNTLENKGDDIYHQGISDIFDNEKDARELIKNKSILETLEKCMDCAEDISDIIKGILVKMS